METTVAKSSKGASLLAVSKDTVAEYDGTNIKMKLPGNTILFVEYHTSMQPTGGYVNKLRQCFLPETAYFRGDDFVFAASYKLQNGKWEFQQMHFKNGKFQKNDSGTYMIKVFRWSFYCMTDKNAIVIQEK